MPEYRYFSEEEFVCQHTGRNEIKEDLLFRLDFLRDECGFPFVITSGYRDPTHPVEAIKVQPGTHSQGIAADIRVTNGFERRLLVKQALKLGFSGIGVAKAFVHVDVRNTSPVLWTY